MAVLRVFGYALVAVLVFAVCATIGAHVTGAIMRAVGY